MRTARRLQGPGGCAWDRAQSVNSLLPYLIEETWEVFESVRRRRRDDLQEELGDVLYTTLFLLLIAERQGWFTLRATLNATRRKMIRRHPHVFGRRQASNLEEAYASWQVSKRREAARPSRSKELRPLLVALWEVLHDRPAAAPRLTRLVAQLRPRRLTSSREMRSISGTEPRKSLRDFSGQGEGGGVSPHRHRPWPNVGVELTDRPGNAMPGRGERQSNRQAEHQIRQAWVEDGKHRTPPETPRQ